MSITSLRFTGQNSNRANIAFTIALFTILGALGFEYIGGFLPCELCLTQRLPYYVGLPVLAAILIFWQKLPAIPRIVGTLFVTGLFAWGAYLGGYHSGVEWGFWPGPTSCAGAATSGLSFESINSINDVSVIACDEVQWRFMGLSFAGYNALISTTVAAVLCWSVLGQIQSSRTEKK